MNVVGQRSHSPEIAILAAPGALPLAMARLASRSETEFPHARTVTPSTAIGSPRMCPAANDTPCVSKPDDRKEQRTTRSRGRQGKQGLRITECTEHLHLSTTKPGRQNP